MAKEKVGFKNHPELRDGEVFLTNVSKPTTTESLDYRFRDLLDDDDYFSIGWKTKRMGNTAYDIYGDPITHMAPVFVQREEMQRGGIDPNQIWSQAAGA